MYERVLYIVFILMFGFTAYRYLSHFIFYMKQDKNERNNPVTECYVCENQVSKTARSCPSCGEDFGKGNYMSQSPNVLFGIFILFLVLTIMTVYALIVG